MYYTTILPIKPLSEYIKYFWILEVNASQSSVDFSFQAFPDGFTGMICQDNNSVSHQLIGKSQKPLPVNYIFGQQTTRVDFFCGGFSGMLGVSFTPHALYYLLNIPADNIKRMALDLETAWGVAGKYLDERLFAENCKLQKIKHIETFMLSRLKHITEDKNEYILAATRDIFNTGGLISIAEICKKIGFSERYLFNHFAKIIGLNPKETGKVIRLQRALRLMEQQSDSLTEVAFNCGFYDQAHFIKDFKNYAGVTPKTYVNNLPKVENLAF